MNACNAVGASGFDVRRYVLARNIRATLEPYKASAELEAFIVASAPPHHAAPDAPSTFAELTAANAAGGSLPVFDGGCDQTIYSSPSVNHAFRAWHDSLHIAHGAGFNAKGEARVSHWHCRAAQSAGLSRDDVAALHFDVWGQFVYAENHGGEFPNDQAMFVAACFEYGLETAASLDF